MTERKKLIEVALPLEAINAACKADKDRKTGTVRNLHKWFAPMPPPAWRALLAAAVLDAPDESEGLADALALVEDVVTSGPDRPPPSAIHQLRSAMRNSAPDLPTVFDPFCGAGSTLVEAQRMGLPSYGSDLSPVAVTLTKFLIEDLPRIRVAFQEPPPGHPSPYTVADSLAVFDACAQNLAKELRAAALDDLQAHYPNSPAGNPISAWRWAATVPSPDPYFRGQPVPLVSDWWLSKKPGEKVWLEPFIDKQDGAVTFAIARGAGTPPPPSKNKCILSGAPISFSYIRQAGRQGELKWRLLAAIASGPTGREYIAGEKHHERPADCDSQPWLELPLPQGGLGFRLQEYGLAHWSDVFSPRQQLSLTKFADLVAALPEQLASRGWSRLQAELIARFFGICVSKMASYHSRQCLWRVRRGPSKVEAAFSRAALPMPLDFAEANPFGGSVGDWLQVVRTSLRAIEHCPAAEPVGIAKQGDAREVSPPDGPILVATDPPYFSQIGYGDLSDYFYVWLRRSLGRLSPDMFSTLLAPKSGELIADPSRFGGDQEAAKSYFVEGFTETFSRLLELTAEFPLLVIYAYKQQEEGPSGRSSTGWEALLEAMISAGIAIKGTWPIHGTGSTRQRAQASNALATYVLLVCRAQDPEARLASRKEFLSVLRHEMPQAIRTMMASGIAPVDLAQAVIGPGMAIYSRYRRVVDADGERMPIRDALAAMGRVLEATIGEAELDLDADTRWAVAWFENYGMSVGPFGQADALARSKVTSVEGLVRAGIVRAHGGRVQLIARSELPDEYDPRNDSRVTVWELAQQLTRHLEQGGEVAAGDFLRMLGGFGESARDLAYRLYSICDRKGWTEEALAFNSLVVAWPQLTRLAADQPAGSANQAVLDL